MVWLAKAVTAGLAFGAGADLADTGAFLARVVRLDPGALVRLRPAGEAAVGLWAWLPIDVLATRVIRGSCLHDVTVSARDLLAAVTAARDHGDAGLPMPAGRDRDWRGPLPAASHGGELDEVPAEVVRQLVRAGEEAFRTAEGEQRSVSEALLEHESLRVSAGEVTVAVPLRMLLGLARMGFLGDEPVRVGRTGGWIWAAGSFGAAYRRAEPTPLITTRRHV